MKVLHVIPSISAKRGGPSIAIFDMCQALNRLDITTLVVTTTDDGPGQVAKNLKCGTICKIQNVNVLAFPKHLFPLGFLSEFSFSISYSLWLINNIHKYDIVHVHALFSFPSTFAMLICRITSKPYILRTIGQLNIWSLTQSRFRKLVALFIVEKANILGSSCLHFTSNQEAREVFQSTFVPSLHLHPYLTLPLGVPCTSPSNQTSTVSSQTPIRFLFLSRLHPKKQIELLFLVLSDLSLHDSTFSWTLDIVGEGEPSYLDYLRTYSEKLGISGNISWHGFLTGDDKNYFLANSDWFVLPSSSENFGIAAAEALSFGLPVIISNEVAVSEYIQGTSAGYVCDPNRESLRAVLKLARYRPSQAMREAAKSIAINNFDWQKISASIANLYLSILRDKQSDHSLPTKRSSC